MTKTVRNYAIYTVGGDYMGSYRAADADAAYAAMCRNFRGYDARNRKDCVVMITRYGIGRNDRAELQP